MKILPMYVNSFDPLPKKQILLILFVFFLTILVSRSALFAQAFSRIEIPPSSFNPVGSGARALGMGGAFIAIADDATAASWNPGGLVQLERPEISVVGAYFHRKEDLDFRTNPEGNGTNSVSESRLNYLSAVYPFTLFGINMVVSANYQNLYDLTRDWNFNLYLEESNVFSNWVRDIDYEQDGTISAWGLAYSVQILPRFSFGVTFNIWEDGIYSNEWDNTVFEEGSGSLPGGRFTYQYRTKDEYEFSGFNMNIGFLWNIVGGLNLGAVLKTPFTADLVHRSSFKSYQSVPDIPGEELYVSDSTTKNEDLDMPMSVGVGLSYRFSDSFTASFDVYRTSWDDFELEDSEGNKISPISGRPSSESDVDPTYQVRLGAEYLFIRPQYVVPLRAGLFYDPAPSESSSDNFYGFSVGSGIGIGRYIFDVAYQYRYGNNVGSSLLQEFDFSEDVKEHTVYGSIIIHF